MFKAALNGKTRDKDPQESSCLIPISIGQNLHEGEKLEATIQLINATFKSCTIVIADTLYRHTTPCDEDETKTDVHERTKALGTQWRTRNAETLSKLTIQHRIVSWDEYLKSELFPQKKEFIEQLYREDSKFEKAVNGAVGKFIKRRRSINSDINVDQAFNDSLEYLKEECAIWLLWAEQQKPNFLVYPNKLYEPLSYLRQFFSDKSDIILQPLIISFQTIKKTITLDGVSAHENGHGYVQNFMRDAGESRQPNPAGFFHAKPPVCLEMSKEELSFFVQGHLNLMMDTMKGLDAKRQQSFLTYYLAQLSQITNPITITDDTDSSSDSSEHDISPGLSPDDDPADIPQLLQIDNTK